MGDKYADAMIELNDFLEEVKEKGVLSEDDIIQEVKNVFSS